MASPKLQIHYCLPQPVNVKTKILKKRIVSGGFLRTRTTKALYWLYRTPLYMHNSSPKQYSVNVTTQMLDFFRSGSMQMARCCNHRCHKQGQTGSQHLSLALCLPLTHSLCGTKWSATLNKSLHYRAAAGIHLSALGSSRILSLLLAGSKSNKQEDKWRARRKTGGKERTTGKTVRHLLPTNSIRWRDTCRTKMKSSESHHSAAELDPWHPFYNVPLTKKSRLTAFISARPFPPIMTPPPTLIIYPLSISLSCIPAIIPLSLFFLYLSPSLPSPEPFCPITPLVSFPAVKK